MGLNVLFFHDVFAPFTLWGYGSMLCTSKKCEKVFGARRFAKNSVHGSPDRGLNFGARGENCALNGGVSGPPTCDHCRSCRRPRAELMTADDVRRVGPARKMSLGIFRTTRQMHRIKVTTEAALE